MHHSPPHQATSTAQAPPTPMATILTAFTRVPSAAPRPDSAPAGASCLRPPSSVGFGAGRAPGRGLRVARMSGGPATPPEISNKVEESIKKAEEACAGDPASGECAAAWDEVEELSAAASHKRDQLKDTDPLEEFCKDNPSTEYCRTYDD